MSLLVISEILGPFVKTVTGDDKNSFCTNEILPQPTQMQLPKKQITFSQFFAVFLKFTLNFNFFVNKMTIIAYVFPELQTVKDVIRQMSKKP